MDERVLTLKRLAEECRLNVLRMLLASGHGHVVGALSAIDMVTALYFDIMDINPSKPNWPDRDRFLLSAGHKCLAQYAVLAERGYFDKAVLDTYGSLHTKIPGHPDMHKLPGVEANTGALGHGLSIACGMAAAARLQGCSYRTFVIMGDGELPEGSNWEAAAASPKFGLDNLVLLLDYNGLQISGPVNTIMDMEPIADKFSAFGWHVLTMDGNDMEQIVDTLDLVAEGTGKPTVIIAKTIKAKGLNEGEGDVDYHFWAPTSEALDQAEADTKHLIVAIERELEAVS
ncbi:transketolase [Eubacterium aggregans]|uniref:transketolase n=1 Tax=Eubacterium aggregans TaxID=81409 RepID=UPI003F2C79A9